MNTFKTPDSGTATHTGLSSTCISAGTFLRGVLDKVGVQPELVRIGKFKSAGDQLLRSDMSVRRPWLVALPVPR